MKMRDSPSPIEGEKDGTNQISNEILSTGRCDHTNEAIIHFVYSTSSPSPSAPAAQLLAARNTDNNMNNRPPRAYPVIIGILPFLLLFVGVAIFLPPTLTNPLSIEYSLSADSSSSNDDVTKPLLRKPSDDRLLPIAWLMSFPVSNVC